MLLLVEGDVLAFGIVLNSASSRLALARHRHGKVEARVAQLALAWLLRRDFLDMKLCVL